MTIYAPQGDWWDDVVAVATGKQTGTAMTSVAPKVDFVRIWSGIQEDMRVKHGIYRYDDGRPVSKTGLTLPLLTYDQLKGLYNGWLSVGDSLINELQQQGRSDLISTVLAEKSKLIGRYVDWYLAWSAQSAELRNWKGQYVRFNSVFEVFQAISRYVFALSGGAWAQVNIESPYQRAVSALPFGIRQLFQAGWWTAESAVPAIRKAVDEGVKVVKVNASVMWWLFKNWPYVGAAGAVAYVVFKTKPWQKRAS